MTTEKAAYKLRTILQLRARVSELEAELAEFREQSKVQHQIFLKERAEVKRLRGDG